MNRSAVPRCGWNGQLGPWPKLAMEAAAIGAVSGLTVGGVRLVFRLLQWCATGHGGLLSAAADELPLWRRAATPALGGLAAMVVLTIARRVTTGLKTTEYVEAVRFEEGRISLVSSLWRTLSSACSVATGAAIGREGTMVQFAAAVVSFLGQHLRWIRLPLARQVACAVAAAIAAAYQAPLAGTFFAVEIVLGTTEWRAIPILLISAFTGEAASRTVLAAGPLFAPHHAINIAPGQACIALLLGAILGVLGPIYLWLIRSLRFAVRLPLALFWSGAAVGILSIVTGLVWGNGDAALLDNLQSSDTVHGLLVVLLLRLSATVFCVGTGTSGGVFTPTLFVGSALGLLICALAHGGNSLLFAVIGMSCLLAASTHAPLMAAFMTSELTGQWIIFPLVLICNVVAWQVARHISSHSLYAIASDEPIALPRAELTPRSAPEVSGSEVLSRLGTTD
jgi:chloride channel protein, CIC family